MAHFVNSKRLSIYLLLCLLSVDFLLSATIETVQIFEDDEIYGEDEDEEIYGEDEDVLNNDFFPFTTRKRYIWEDWTVPTRDYSDYHTNSGNVDFLLYVFIPIFVIGCIISIVYVCIKHMQSDGCTSLEDSHSSNAYTTVHRPPERRRDVSAQVHRPPIERNLTNVTFVGSSYASNSQNISQPDNIASEKPPDYSTVTLSDLVNPAKPAFPAVKRDDETPPPQYSKENPFLK